MDKQNCCAGLQVEQRESDTDGFGRGRSMEMQFDQFAQHLIDKSNRFYMTTQPLPELSDGRPDLMAEPVTSLAGAQPLAGLTGGNHAPVPLAWLSHRSLAPQAISHFGLKSWATLFPLRTICGLAAPLQVLQPIWTPCMLFPVQQLRADGHQAALVIFRELLSSHAFRINSYAILSSAGSSSGLHHDFHDNLYVLIHGRKSFKLFSPADTENMYTRGHVEIVHPNGRICYTVCAGPAKCSCREVRI